METLVPQKTIEIPKQETCKMSVQEFYQFRTKALEQGITFDTKWENKSVLVTAEPKLLIELGFIDNFDF
jgi:hypothetical protein